MWLTFNLYKVMFPQAIFAFTKIEDTLPHRKSMRFGYFYRTGHRFVTLYSQRGDSGAPSRGGNKALNTTRDGWKACF